MRNRCPHAGRPGSARFAAWVLVWGLVLAGTARADRRVYYAPAALGDGSGTDRANARAFNANDVIYRVLADNADPVAEMHFAPGNYSLKKYLFSPATGDRERQVVRLVGDGERPEDTVIRNDKPLDLHAEDRMARLNGIGRIEIDNLTFDGNWDEKMRLAGHPALDANCKNQPLHLTARTGHLRRVIVRNCGSVGYLPQSRFDNVAGTEAFPLSLGTTDEGQGPESGDAAPWVVEDCEVHGFHPEYGGYTTMVMAIGSREAGKTPAWAAADRERQLIVVRRCQIRGVPGGAGIIALGSAGCGPGELDGGRVTYADNLLLNASLGFNTDCGRMVNFRVTNSMFLDVWSIGNIGALYPGMMDRYRVSGNAVRLSGRTVYRTYVNYAWRGGRQVTDPGLVLGRRETNEVYGIGCGAAGELRWDGNWFTTRPRSQFAGEGIDPSFRLFRKYTAADTAAAGGFADIAGMEAGGNALSSLAWDFAGMALLPGGSHPRFGADTVPEATRLRTAIEDSADDFRPIGTVERVLPRYVVERRRWQARQGTGGGGSAVRTLEADEPVLAGAIEVVLGQPRWDPRGEWRLSARLAMQPTPRFGAGGTVPLRGSNLWIELSGPVTARLSGVTDARGVAEFRIAPGSLKPGLLRMRAVHDPTARGDREPFREYRSAYATATHPIGTVVSVEASPDVAQAGGQPAHLVFRRTGRTLGELPELEVYFRMASEAMPAVWGEEFEVIAPAGTRANLDRLGRLGVGRVTFAPGDRTAVLDVVPRTGASLRNSLVQVRVLAGPAQTYGTGDASATVLVHHGPEWALELLPSANSTTTRIADLGALSNSGIRVAGHAVGVALDAAGRESPVLWRWRLDGRRWEDASAQVADFGGVRPVAVGQLDGQGVPVIVGNRAGPRGPIPWSNAGHAPGWVAEAGGVRVVTMSEDASWVVGMAGDGPSRRVVAWHGGAPALAVGLPAGANEAEAVGIDADGRVVGNARQAGRSVAFRTAKMAGVPVEWLAPLEAGTDAHAAGCAASGITVGWSGAGANRRAVAWHDGAGSAPIELPGASGLPETMAHAVNQAGEVIAMGGRGGQFATPYLAAAVVGGGWKPLDDPHHVSGIPPGFEWGVPVAINEQGWVAGNGRWQGRDVAWVLRRQRARSP